MSPATIVSVLTSPRPGAIAVIDVTGPSAIELVAGVARPRRSKHVSELAENVAVRADFYDGDAHVDEGLVVVRAGHRERAVVELHTHGSPRVVQRLVAALTRAVATLADRPPTQDLDALMVRARTRRALDFVLQQARAIDDHIAALCMHAAQHDREWLIREIDALLARRHCASRVLDGFTVAIVGPPGAGKSTLANRLIGEARLLTSDQPGTTRDTSHEPAAVDGIPLTLIDTAGHRMTDHPIEAEAIRRGRTAAAEADVRLVVLDRATTLTPEAQTFLDLSRPVLLAANKCDSPPCWRLGDLASDIPTVEISARTGEGIRVLRAALREAAGLSDDALARPALLTDAQRDAVAAARAACDIGPLANWPSIRRRPK